jgi:hypothetical protein
MSGTLNIYDLLAMQFQHPRTCLPEIGEENTYLAIQSLITNHNAIMRNMLNDLAEFMTEHKQESQAMRPKDADALRILSDQLLEHGLDPGAALLRDVADRIEATAKPWFVDWPKELGVGELAVRHVEVREMRNRAGFYEPSPQWRLLIEAELIGVWTMHVHEVDRPGGRVTYRR